MTNAKLTKDNIQKKAFINLFQSYLTLEKKLIDVLNEATANNDFKNKIYRQLNSIASIIRKEITKRA